MKVNDYVRTEDGIKEILDNFEKYEARYKLHNETQFIITHREIQMLLDYITNLQEELNNQIEIANNRYVEITKLQQENERLENRNIYYINNEKKLLSDWHQEHNEAIEYKSRNKKAIECIKDNLTREWGEYLYGYEDLLNILNGGDENE